MKYNIASLIFLGYNYRKKGVQATTILENIKGIGKIELTEKDVVRHELVQRIIKAYDKFEKREEYRKMC